MLNRERWATTATPRRALGRAGRTLLVAIAVAEIGAGILLMSSVEEKAKTEMAEQAQFRFATAQTENDDARFAFRYPPDWRVTHVAGRSELRDPGDKIVIALGPAPRGDLLHAGEDMHLLLEQSYTDVTRTAKKLDFIGAEPALMMRGRAVNDAGSLLAYSLVILEGDTENYAITGFVSSSADTKEARLMLDEVIRSFQPVEPT